MCSSSMQSRPDLSGSSAYEPNVHTTSSLYGCATGTATMSARHAHPRIVLPTQNYPDTGDLYTVTPMLLST